MLVEVVHRTKITLVAKVLSLQHTTMKRYTKPMTAEASAKQLTSSPSLQFMGRVVMRDTYGFPREFHDTFTHRKSTAPVVRVTFFSQGRQHVIWETENKEPANGYRLRDVIAVTPAMATV